MFRTVAIQSFLLAGTILIVVVGCCWLLFISIIIKTCGWMKIFEKIITAEQHVYLIPSIIKTDN